MRASSLIATTTIVFILVPSFAQARSCSDVLNTCLKTYGGIRTSQGDTDPTALCNYDYKGCMATGTWAGKTATFKGLEKK